MNDKKQDDSLKQLEKMLADDVKDRGFTGLAIRLSVSLILILVLYFIGIFDRPIFISFAILCIVSIEIYRYMKLKKQKTDNLN
jgi:phosphatidylserine synthase